MQSLCRARPWRWVLLAVLGWVMGLSHSAIDPDRQSAAAQRLGAGAPGLLRAWQQAVRQAGGNDDEGRVHSLNQYVNRRVTYREDIEIWGVNDYWASPVETLGRGVGDCEDFAIAKYSGLVASGVPARDLRLVYVRAALGGGQVAHMVLAYYPPGGGEPLIMDNLVSEVRPASRRPDLTPVFSFNAEGLWQGTHGASAGDPVARLSKWRDVLARSREEGSL